MIELYGMSSPNVAKIVIMLEEIGLEWRFHRVDVVKGDQFKSHFAKLNLNMRVPVIHDAQGPDGPVTLSESGAILIYLAEKSGTLLPESANERLRAIQWLMWQMSAIGPMFGQFSHFIRYSPAEAEYARIRFQDEVERLFDVLDRRLGDVPYLSGSYSIADIATVPWVDYFTLVAKFVSLERRPNAERWLNDVLRRPAVERALRFITEARNTDRASFVTASEEDMARFFHRRHALEAMSGDA